MSDTAESEDKAINQSPSSQSADEGTASSENVSALSADISGAADNADYSAMTVTELKDIAKSKGLTGYSTLTKAELTELLENS